MDSQPAPMQDIHDLPYAVAAPSYAHKVWAGAAIVLSGLGLVVLGGCFLIGVMIISTRGFSPQMVGAPLNPASLVLVCALYCLAIVSFVCAALVIVCGLRALFRVMRG